MIANAVSVMHVSSSAFSLCNHFLSQIPVPEEVLLLSDRPVITDDSISLYELASLRVSANGTVRSGKLDRLAESIVEEFLVINI